MNNEIYLIFTVRNSNWEMVMFLHLSVILFTGGGRASKDMACVVGETATAMDGAHPTGMHSCSLNIVTEFSELSDRKIVFQKDYLNL